MLEIFYEKKDFFLLKELEKIAPKEKGKRGSHLLKLIFTFCFLKTVKC